MTRQGRGRVDDDDERLDGSYVMRGSSSAGEWCQCLKWAKWAAQDQTRSDISWNVGGTNDTPPRGTGTTTLSSLPDHLHSVSTSADFRQRGYAMRRQARSRCRQRNYRNVVSAYR